MVRPLDVAWSILKFDLSIGSKHRGHHEGEPDLGDYISRYTHSKKYHPALMEGNHNAANFKTSIFSHMDEDSPMRRKYENMDRNTLNLPNFPVGPIKDEHGTYYRGMSVPRIQDDGSYVGVNLDQILGRMFEKDFDKGAEDIARIGAHEQTHRLINDEIEQWAKQQTNIEALEREQQKNIERLTQQYPPLKPHPFGLRPNTAGDVLVRAGIDLDPYGDERYPETFHDLELDQAENSYYPLRSIGHEFGAYSLTPDSSSPTGFMTAEERFDRMGGPVYQGAEYYHPDPELRSDLSELHTVGPSEDQAEYEQMLFDLYSLSQEQQAAGDVNPQTSVQ